MEDIIYFLLLIGWVAFSFYQQNEKKKRKKAQMEAARSNEQSGYEQDDNMSEDDQQESSGSDFKRVFEGLLMDDEDGDLEMETAGERSSRQSPKEEEKNIYQDFFENELAKRNSEQDKLKSQVKLEKKIAALEKDMVLLEDDDDTDSQNVNRFNLRDAVIYSEILSRKY